MIPSLNASFQSGVSGDVSSAASSGSVPAVATLAAPGADPALLKYGLIAAGAVVLLIVAASAMRK